MRPVILAIALLCATAVTGCGLLRAVNTLLPKVVAAANDAGFVLDQVKSFTDIWFAARPDPVRKGEVDRAIESVRGAANKAVRVASDASKTAQDADAALADIRKAWTELRSLTEPMGVRVAVPGEPTKLGASPDGRELVVLEPLALSLKAGE